VKSLKKVQVLVYSEPGAALPKYETSGAAGMDIRAKESVSIGPNSTTLVKTGLYVKIPEGYEIQIRARSGLSLKSGLRVANGVGTIDSDYTGEVCVILHNTSSEPYQVVKGDKIAQMVLNEVPQIEWLQVDTQQDLGRTDRGSNGFGSTG
jgi:dUTP pyrophosphatase